MTMCAFPFDRKMASLAVITDPDQVMRQIERHRDALGIAREWRCRAVGVHGVKYRPGKHCVVRHRLDLEGPGGERLELELYCKAYASDRAALLFRSLAAVSRGLAGRPGAFEVPRPLLHLEDARAVWQEAWPGSKLSAADPSLRVIGWRGRALVLHRRYRH
jgi:hypothetical protein